MADKSTLDSLLDEIESIGSDEAAAAGAAVGKDELLLFLETEDDDSALEALPESDKLKLLEAFLELDDDSPTGDQSPRPPPLRPFVRSDLFVETDSEYPSSPSSSFVEQQPEPPTALPNPEVAVLPPTVVRAQPKDEPAEVKSEKDDNSMTEETKSETSSVPATQTECSALSDWEEELRMIKELLEEDTETPQSPDEIIGGETAGVTTVSVLKIESIATLGKQIYNADALKKTGAPTCLALGAPPACRYAIGSRFGMTSLFDQNAARLSRGLLGSANPNDRATHNTCTCVSIWQTGDHIVVGHSNGEVNYWSTGRHGLKKRINDEFHAPIVRVSFLDKTEHFVALDATGLVKLFISREALGACRVSSFVVHNPQHTAEQRAAALAAEAQAEGEGLPTRSSSRPTLVQAIATVPNCLASPTPLIAMVDHHRMRVAIIKTELHKAMLEATTPQFDYDAEDTGGSGGEGSFRCMPSVTWCTGTGEGHMLLAAAWGLSVHVLRVMPDAEQPTLLTFTVRALVRMDNNVRGLSFISHAALCVVHTAQEGDETKVLKDSLSVVDVHHGKVAETRDLASLGIVNRELHATDCSHSIEAFGGSCYVLGQKEVVVIKALRWEERLDALVSASEWEAALRQAREFFRGEALIPIGLPSGADARESAVQERVGGIIKIYLSTGLNAPSSGKEEYFRKLGERLFTYCIELEVQDLLFGEVYDRFVDNEATAVFMQLLEPAVVDTPQTIRRIPARLVPEVFDHYDTLALQEKAGTEDGTNAQSVSVSQRRERFFMKLNTRNLDFEQLRVLCLKYDMFGALATAFIGKDDYTSILSILLEVVASLPEGSERRDSAARALLSYMAACTAGVRFGTTDDISDGDAAQVKRDVLVFLFHTEGTSKSPPQERFPRVFLLLHYTREFLAALTPAFADSSDSAPWRQADLPKHISREGIVATLFTLLADTSPECEWQPWKAAKRDWPPFDKLVEFYMFLSLHIAKCNIKAQPPLLHRIVSHLAYQVPEDGPQGRRERQEHLVAMLQHFPMDKLDVSNLLLAAKQARFTPVCVYLHAHSEDYSSIIADYLADSDAEQRRAVFPFIGEQLEAGKHEKIRTGMAPPNLEKLVAADNEALARILIQHFASEVSTIWHQLEGSPETLYQLFRGLFVAVTGQGKQLSEEEELDAFLSDDRSAAAAATRRAQSMDVLRNQELQQKYLGLLCEFDPKAVPEFLQKYDDYLLDAAMAECQRHKLTRATSFLKERAGATADAMKLLLEETRLRIAAVVAKAQAFVAEVQRNEAADPNAETTELPEIIVEIRTSDEFAHLEEDIDYCIKTCVRNSIRADQGAQTLWFMLLDAFVKAKQLIRGQKGQAELAMSELYTDCIKYILLHMMSHVPLRFIIRKIVQDNGSDSFGQFKPVLMGMLENYNYELELFARCLKATSLDTHALAAILLRSRGAFVTAQSRDCATCCRSLTEKESPDAEDHALQVFSCGHAFHAHCHSKEYCHLCQKEEVRKDKSGKKPKRPKTESNQTRDTRAVMRRIDRIRNLLASGIRVQVLEEIDDAEITGNIFARRIFTPLPPNPEFNQPAGILGEDAEDFF